MGSGAREFFEGVRAAQRLIDGALARLSAMREREGARSQSYGTVGGGRACGDGMRAVDARLDYEARVRAEIDGFRAEVERGRRVCAGVRAANPGLRWADALELRYISCLPWRQVADALGVSESQAKSDASAALDWVDSVGVAKACEGVGQAQPF